MSVRCFIFFSLLLPVFCSAAASFKPVVADPVLEPWRWKQEEALSGLGVLCMDEAEDGTFWFGNVGSLAHYDGKEVVTFPFGEDLLSKINIQQTVPWAKSLMVLPDGNILVLIGRSLMLRTSSGQWRLIIKDTGESVFTPRMVRDSDGVVWLIVPEGLWRIASDLSRASCVMKAKSSQPLESFCLDSKGHVWLVQRTGDITSRLINIPVRNSVPEQKNDWKIYTVPFANDRVEARIIEDPNGLIRYASGATSVGLPAFDPGSEKWLPGTGEPRGYFSIMKSRDGFIWAGAEGGLIRLSPSGHESYYTVDQYNLPRVPLSLYQDRSQRLWILGRVGYVYSVDLSDREWTTYAGLLFQCEQPDGVQWFINRWKAVVSYDPRSGKWTRYSEDDNLIDRSLSLTSSSHGLIWAAGEHRNRAAIAVFDGKTWTRFCHPDFARWIEPKAAFEALDGTMWFGAGGRKIAGSVNAGGALQYEVTENGEARLLKHYAPPEFPYFVTAINQSKDGALWIGSTQLSVYSGNPPSLTPFPELQGENTIDIAIDRDETVWVAKEHFGVCQRTGDGWDVFGINDGLPSLLFSGFLVMDDGSLMVSSGRGISRFDGKTWVAYAYSDWFGMEKRFSSMKKSADGTIWFNYAANEAREARLTLSPDLSYCTIRHRPENVPPDTVMVDYLERVAQPGNCHVSWSGHDPWSNTSADDLQFSWRLDSGEWSAFSKNFSRTFLNLASGKHTLEVRARDKAFNVDPTPALINFTVIAPVWKQPWFILMMMLFVGGIIMFIRMWFYFHDKHLKAQQKHLLEMQQLKISFFTNISHELRTPLSVMLSPLESLLRAEKDDVKRQKLSMVIRSASRVSTLITQLLDFRKLEQGQMSMQLSEGDVVQPVRDAFELIQPLAEVSGVSCKMEGISEYHGWADQDKLRKIASNLIGNAVKYTPSGAEMRVVLDAGRDSSGRTVLSLTVEDAGPGIEPEHLEHIFKRFYRVPEKSIVDGSGIGLNLTKELVDLWGGEIRAESPISDDADCPGTRFVVLLTIDPDELGKKG